MLEGRAHASKLGSTWILVVMPFRNIDTKYKAVKVPYRDTFAINDLLLLHGKARNEADNKYKWAVPLSWQAQGSQWIEQFDTKHKNLRWCYQKPSATEAERAETRQMIRSG